MSMAFATRRRTVSPNNAGVSRKSGETRRAETPRGSVRSMSTRSAQPMRPTLPVKEKITMPETDRSPLAAWADEREIHLRPLIEAILRRYHTTRTTDDAVEYILAGSLVRLEFERLFAALRRPWRPS